MSRPSREVKTSHAEATRQHQLHRSSSVMGSSRISIIAFHVALLITPLVACNPRLTAPTKGTPTRDGESISSLVMEGWTNKLSRNMNNTTPFNLFEVVIALRQSNSLESSQKLELPCIACRSMAGYLIGYIRGGGPIEPVIELITSICSIGLDKNVCRAFVNMNKDILHYIVQYSSITGRQLCAMITSAVSLRPCGVFQGPSWAVALPPPNRKYATSNSFSENRSIRRGSPPYPSFNDGRPYLKVLHLTDIHFDPHYTEGSSAVCRALLCCQSDSGRPRVASDSAGRWGDYRLCDSPRVLIENMLQNIQQKHTDIDYIMWTGDSVAHDMWKTSQRSNKEVITGVNRMIHKYFPGVPVYGAIGNHESNPTNVFPPPEIPEVWERFGIQWLYDISVDQWQTFLPNTPIAPSARIAGCYSMPVRRGFKIISINTNYCYKLNWWVLFKTDDPGNILKWLVGELLTAEANREYVHIIGHIAPFDITCYEEWGNQFSRIVTRFSHIIRGQFYGHDHLDQIRLHFDVKKTRDPVGVEYLTPSNGPYYGYNPSFRLYYVDGDHEYSTRNVIDYETHYMNLTNANANGDARWELLYWAKQDLGMDSLEPEDWEKFVQRLRRDPELSNRWYRYQVRASDPRLAKGCAASCRQNQICGIERGGNLLSNKC